MYLMLVVVLGLTFGCTPATIEEAESQAWSEFRDCVWTSHLEPEEFMQIPEKSTDSLYYTFRWLSPNYSYDSCEVVVKIARVRNLKDESHCRGNFRKFSGPREYRKISLIDSLAQAGMSSRVLFPFVDSLLALDSIKEAMNTLEEQSRKKK